MVFELGASPHFPTFSSLFLTFKKGKRKSEGETSLSYLLCSPTLMIEKKKRGKVKNKMKCRVSGDVVCDVELLPTKYRKRRKRERSVDS